MSPPRLPAGELRHAAGRARSPTAGAGASGSLAAAAGASTTVSSPLEALERDEILRTRRFCLVATGIAVVGLATIPFLSLTHGAEALMIGGICGILGSLAFLWRRSQDPIAFRKPSTGVGWFIPAIGVVTGLPAFGAFSPVPMLLVLGIYFIGLGKSGPLAAAVYATCAGMQALVGGLAIAGHESGMVRVDLGLRDRVLIQMLVQVVLLGAYVTARMSRRTVLLAVGELERAVREAAHREALLREAREELDRALRPGRGRFSDQTIAGYQLGALLGRGAMGEVYEASGPSGVVAIKMLAQASLGNPQHVMRFLRELRNAAAISSPHVVRVLEVGEQPVPYLVMEKLDGHTLAELLRRRHGLSPAEIVAMLRQVGAGVTAAGAAGIVHRDLKPQNVFRHGTTWKVLDFGIARAQSDSDTLTAGNVVGTPSYMAPEQARSATVDHRTDLYALAAIAYRAFTGQPPFAGGEIAETLYRVVNIAPRRPSELAELPRQLDLVLAIGLAKLPDARFQNADELVDAITGALSGSLAADMRRRGDALERAGAWETAGS